MSRSLLIASAAVIVLGLLLAVFAPTGNMGAQEAFYARVLLLIPSLICGLILFGFSAVVGAIARLENQGEQLRLLLAARGETSPRQPNRALLPDEEDEEPESAPPSILSRAGSRLRGERGAPAMPEPSRRTPPQMDEDEALAPPSPPPARQAPPRFSPPPMAAPPEPATRPRAQQMDGRAGDLDPSFLDRALRREPGDFAEQPRGMPVPPRPAAPPPAMAQPTPRAPSPPPMAAPPAAPSMPAPPPRAEPPLPPIAPAFSAPPAAAPPAPPTREMPAAEKAPTIAELLERDLANWEPPAEKPKPRLVREGQFAGRNYRTFDDGSLEIDTEQSTLRFDSLEEFRAFVGSSHQ